LHATSTRPLAGAAAFAAPIPVNFDSVGVDKKAIERLLEEYTKAASTNDQARFEALLLRCL